MCFKVKTRFDKFPRTSTNDHESSYTLDIKMKQSSHVETVCLLSNTQSKKKESYITLDVEMEDYYRIKNEGKNSTT